MPGEEPVTAIPQAGRAAPRRAELNHPPFTEAHEVLLCRPEDVASRVTLTESSVVVLMTHNYTHDLDLLPFLLGSPARYIGCLGPRRRTERLLAELQGESELAEERLSGRLHAPMDWTSAPRTPPRSRCRWVPRSWRRSTRDRGASCATGMVRFMLRHTGTHWRIARRSATSPPRRTSPATLSARDAAPACRNRDTRGWRITADGPAQAAVAIRGANIASSCC